MIERLSRGGDRQLLLCVPESELALTVEVPAQPLVPGHDRHAEVAPDVLVVQVVEVVGYVDTISHARRLTVPTLLAAGTADEVCPLDTIESLYQRLPATRSLSVFDGLGHRYSREFIPLVAACARLYA